ncbi:hypothetical protein CSPX01_13288, partial [Colletotrichum filicis]
LRELEEGYKLSPYQPSEAPAVLARRDAIGLRLLLYFLLFLSFGVGCWCKHEGESDLSTPAGNRIANPASMEISNTIPTERQWQPRAGLKGYRAGATSEGPCDDAGFVQTFRTTLRSFTVSWKDRRKSFDTGRREILENVGHV